MTAPAPGLPMAGLATLPNMLTFGRIMVSPVLFWLILEAEPDRGTTWAAFVLGVVMAVTDFFDGRIARASHTVSRSGAFLDPLADKVVVLGTAFSLVAVDRLHWVPVAIVAARELWISLYRIRWARQGLSLPARTSAKWKSFIQGLALLIAVLPLLEDQQRFVEGCWWFAVAWTVYTGWQYLRDGATTTSLSGA